MARRQRPWSREQVAEKVALVAQTPRRNVQGEQVAVNALAVHRVLEQLGVLFAGLMEQLDALLSSIALTNAH